MDQKFNRKKVAELSKNKKVLDTFTHTGAFGLNAFYGGASSVVSVDISEEAVETVRTNIIQNKASKVMKAICADVFDFLKEEEKNGTPINIVIDCLAGEKLGECLKYVAMHELAHTVNPAHDKKFYALIEKYEPNYKQARKLLKK